MKQPESDRGKPLLIVKKSVSVLTRVVRSILYFFVFYFIVVLIGLIPVNNDFQPTPDGIEVMLTSDSVHADIILPIKTATVNWREHFPADFFSGDTSAATHIAIGWGDKGFYIGTPTWDDLRASTVAKALFWPSASCMHVSVFTAKFLPDDGRSVTISAVQYEALVDFIAKSFRYDEDGSKILIEGAAYYSDDAFFEARGSYHCFNTCNSWVGEALQSAGIRTAWFTPLPKTVFLYLPE